MTTPVSDASTYADFAGLDSLKKGASQNDPAAIRQVAKQFESLFAHMMIKSMRDAVGKDPIFGSDQEQMYQSMFDDQLSVEMTRGHGLGLADMLIRQLQRLGVSGANGATNSSSSGSSATTSAGASGTTNKTSASTSPTASSADQASFIKDLWPEAQRAAQQLGVDPRGLLAQAALETNWGRNVPRDASGRSSNNLFGVKATSEWSGASVSASTREFQNGSAATTTGQFRAYGSRAESFQDYVSMLSNNPRYTTALNTGSNVQAFATALQRGGYATDPDYARKVSAIAGGIPSSPSLKSASAVPMYAEVADQTGTL